MAGGTQKQQGKSGDMGRFAISCRGLCVRVVERRFPGADDWIEIENKWLYAFHEPSAGASPVLVDEIFAPRRGDRKIHNWRALKEPGKVKSPESRPNYRNRPSGWYQADPKKKTGTYVFFLSPIQLGPDTIKLLQDRIKATAKNRQAPSYMFLVGTDYFFDLHMEEESPKHVANWHSFEKQPAGRTCILLIPDPFAWAEDLQQLGYQPALYLFRSRQYDKDITNEVIIASAFRGAMAAGGGESDPHKIERHLQAPLNWYAHGRSKPPDLSYTKRLPDGRKSTVAADITPKEWEKSRIGAKTAVDVRLKMYEIEMTALKKMANVQAKRLTDWLEGERHRVVEQGGLELFKDKKKYRQAGGPDMLWYLVVHWAKVTARMGEIEAGMCFQLNMYEKESKRTIQMLFKQAESEGNWWDKTGPLRDGVLSTFKLVENFANALSISDGKQFQPFMKKVLGLKLLGFKWVPPDSDKFPRLFGKAIPASMRAPQIEVPKGTKLADAREAFDKYQIDSWFSAIGIGVAAINLVLAMDKIISGKADSKEMMKAGFDGIGLAADIAKLSMEIPMKRAEQLAKAAMLEDEVMASGMTKAGLKALTRVAAIAGAGGSLIDFHSAVSEFGKEALMNENPEAAMGRVLQATGAAVGFGVSVFGVVFGGLISGPLGWIALAAAGISMFGAWLASHFSRTQWGDVALYSYLGEKAGEGTLYKEYFGGRSNQFYKNLEAQGRAITALMASFIAELYTGAMVNLRIYPGFVDDRTEYFIKWQIGYRGSSSVYPERWAVIEATLKPKEGILRVTKARVTGFPSNIDYRVGKESLIEKVVIADGRCTQFDVYPPIPDSYRHKVMPMKTTVLIRVDVLGNGLVTVPIESSTEFEYKLPNGKETTVHGWGGVFAETSRPEKAEVT